MYIRFAAETGMELRAGHGSLGKKYVKNVSIYASFLVRSLGILGFFLALS